MRVAHDGLQHGVGGDPPSRHDGGTPPLVRRRGQRHRSDRVGEDEGAVGREEVEGDVVVVGEIVKTVVDYLEEEEEKEILVSCRLRHVLK